MDIIIAVPILMWAAYFAGYFDGKKKADSRYYRHGHKDGFIHGLAKMKETEGYIRTKVPDIQGKWEAQFEERYDDIVELPSYGYSIRYIPEDECVRVPPLKECEARIYNPDKDIPS